MDQITALSALELSSAIHAGRLTCRSVMEAYLARIDRLNPLVNAIVSLREHASLLAEADSADAMLRDGRSQGWLHGMPLAVKDLSDVRGLRTTKGSPLYRDNIAVADSIHVARLRAAGGIIIGKTNTAEFGLGSHTYNPVFGPTRNPNDLGLSAGGSSGGAAAALAAHLLPVADGSDMMGSLRNPAAFNGVMGFRPSFGRVPDAGTELFLSKLSTIGPMARTVADLAALLDTQAGYDRRAPLSLERTPISLTAEGALLQHRKLGWLGDFDGHLPFEDGLLDLCRASLSAFESMGSTVEEVRPAFDMDALWESWCRLRHMLVAGSLRADYEQPDRRALLKPEAIWEIEGGLALSAGDVYHASLIRSAWYRHMLDLFERYDALILPAAQVFPFSLDRTWPSEIAGRRMDTYHRWMEVVIGPTLAGLPVAAMPAGLDAHGRHAGIQIIGPPRADAATLRLAAAFEERWELPKRGWDAKLAG